MVRAKVHWPLWASCRSPLTEAGSYAHRSHCLRAAPSRVERIEIATVDAVFLGALTV
jgi:hypothetical protein